MGKVLRIVSTVFALLAIIIALAIDYNQLPRLDPNEYWGSGSAEQYEPTAATHRFLIVNPIAKINALQQKLRENITVPVEFEGAIPASRLKSIINYWRDEYLPKWETRLARLNLFPQYTIEIQG